MTLPCDQVDAFADEELGSADADRFRAHLAGCEGCQQTLHDLLQLELIARSRPLAPVRSLPLRAAPAPLRWERAAVPMLIATGVVAVFALRAPAPELMLGGSTRAFEARLSYPGADRYLPYGGARESQITQPDISLQALAELQRRKNFEAMAAAALLQGNWLQAEALFARAPASAGLQSDAAVLALVRGEREEALLQLDAVLARHPKHGPARWNRALALRDLGLRALAAEEFEHVAKLGEPGWSEEAHQRGEVLRLAIARPRAAWESARREGEAMAEGGPPLNLELARAHPGLARLFLYQAVRSATSGEPIRALMPLAQALDAQSEDPVLYGSLRAAAVSQDLHPRAAPKLEDPRAGAGDILGGWALLKDPTQPPSDRYRQLTRGVKDPWFTLLGVEQTARAHSGAGRFDEAERALLEALPTCNRRGLDYRCAFLELELAKLYAQENRAPEASQHIAQGRAHASRAGDWGLELSFLSLLAQTARLSGGLSLARAYLLERVARTPKSCTTRREAQLSLASMELDTLRVDEAREALEKAPTCEEPLTLQAALLHAELHRFGGSSDEAEQVREGLAALKAQGQLSAGEAALAEAVEGRLEASGDRTASHLALTRAIAAAERVQEGDADGREARERAYAGLVFEAGRSEAFDRALALIAAQAEVSLPAGCVLGVAVDQELSLVVARTAEGEAAGLLREEEGAVGQRPSIPEELLGQLAACPEIEVLASPSLSGTVGLLPPSVAWSFRGGPGNQPHAGTGSRPLVVSDIEPPLGLGLPRLPPWGEAGDSVALTLEGSAATPRRVLEAMENATEIELHAHGLVDLALADASFVVLSPDAEGAYALTAGEVKRRPLRGSPLVVLGACHAAPVAPSQKERWSLPAAFLQAGASAVLAAPALVPDGEAGPFFSAVRGRVRRGESPAVALRNERLAWLERQPGSWVDQVLLFQ